MKPLQPSLEHLKAADPVLGGIIQRVGPYLLAVREPTFETLARSIAFQQLHGRAAAKIFERVRKAAGRRFTSGAFLRVSEQELKACGLSRQKIASLTDLAERVARREISFRKLASLDDDQIVEQLSVVRGVGVWTVQMFLIFALERPNVMPAADFAIRNAIRKAYDLPELPKPSEVARLAEKWRPYCSVASWYLWRSLDAPAGI
ncbi:MAG: DNA-3-methyladenine glycosylase family protein [Bryobacteraceae bacterium]